MTLPLPPPLKSDRYIPGFQLLQDDVEAIHEYLYNLAFSFANAAGAAIDPSVGQGGDGALTVTDAPMDITYTPGSSLSIDGTLFGHIDVTFTKPDRAVDVIIFYKETSDTVFKQSYASMSPFSLLSLKVGTQYNIQLAGQAANGSLGPVSTLMTVEIPVIAVAVEEPTTLQAIATYQSIVLTWVAPVVSKPIKYQVQRANDTLFTSSVVSWDVDATKFVDDVGVIGVTRYYRVRSIDSVGGVSAYTGTVNGTTLNVPDDSIITSKILNDNVTYAKIQNVSAASRLLLRGSAAGAGDVQEGTVSNGIQLVGTVISPVFVVEMPLGMPGGSQVPVGDGKAQFLVTEELNGMNLVRAAAAVTTVSSSGTPTYQVRRQRSGTDVDMLSTKITIDANEKTSYTAATPNVINTTNDDVLTGDLIFPDKDVIGTGENGDIVALTFALP